MNKKKFKFYEYFYLILLGIILVQLFYIPGIRLGVLTSIIIVISLFYGVDRKIIFYNSRINKLILLYICYNSISILWIGLSGIPISVFISEWSNSILPVFFFYFAYGESESKQTFYNVTLFTLICSFILGYVLWVSGADLYRVFMDTTEGAGTDLLFFQSLYGLTATGALGIIGFLIAAHILFESNGRKGKIALIICATAAILTFRRSSLVVLVGAIVVLHFIGYFKYRFLKKRYIILEGIFLYAAYLLIAENYGELIDGLLERGSMVMDAFDERNATWKYAFDYSYIIQGKGLGSVGHKAIGYSTALIPDGNYFKILAETGIYGAMLFILIIAVTVISGVRQLREKYLELGIVICLCLMAIGSNIFTYQSLAPIFWYSIGRISRYKADVL